MAEEKKIFVLFEGPDNVGKTTLVDLIAEKLNLTKYHGPVPPKQEVDQWYCNRLQHVIHECIEKNTHGVIFDRFHISDVAYAGVFGNGRLSPNAYKMMEKMLYNLRCKLVLMYDSPALVHERLVQENKDDLTPEQVRGIIARYALAYATTQISARCRHKLTDLGGIMRVGRKVIFQPEQGFEDLVEWINR